MGILKKVVETLFVDKQENVHSKVESLQKPQPPAVLNEKSDFSKSIPPPPKSLPKSSVPDSFPPAPLPVRAKNKPTPPPIPEPPARQSRHAAMASKDLNDHATDILTEQLTQEEPKGVSDMLRSVPKTEPAWSAPPPFHLANKTVVSGPKELARACEHMSQDTFNHHVNEHKNDFSTWLEDGFKDAFLAQAVANVKTPRELAIALEGKNVPDLPEISEPKRMPAPGEVPLEAEDRPLVVIDRSKEQAYKEEITHLRKELAQLRKALSEELASSIEVLEQGHAEQEALQKKLSEQQQQLREKESQLAQATQHFESEKQTFARQKQEASQLLAHADHIRKELGQKERTLKAAKQAVAEHEKQLSEQREHLERLDRAVADRRVALEEHQRIISDETLHEYAHQQLESAREIKESPQVRSVAAQEVLARIQEARNMLSAGHLAEAKAAYSSLREQFYKADISDGERHELYNSIRELYADVELALLDERHG